MTNIFIHMISLALICYWHRQAIFWKHQAEGDKKDPVEEFYESIKQDK